MPALTPGAITPGDASVAVTAGPATGGAAPYTYQWQTSDDRGVTWGNATGSNTTTLAATLTGLAPDTTTGVRVEATDGTAAVAGSPAQSFAYTTAPGVITLRWYGGL